MASLCLYFPILAQTTSKLTQTIRGTVLDKESQTPLIGATVQPNKNLDFTKATHLVVSYENQYTLSHWTSRM